jgi:MFS family permease
VPPEERVGSTLGLVYAYTTLSWIAYTLISVALPFRFEQLRLSVAQYGTVAAFLALGFLATETVWGVLAHRIANRRWVIGLGSVVALVLLAVGVSDSVPTFALSAGVLGGTVIFPIPLLRWFAFSAGGPGTGGRGTGRYAVFTGTGTVVGSALGPVLFEAVGYFWLAVAALVFWVFGIVILAILPWARLDVPVHSASVLRQVRRIITPYFGIIAILVVLFFFCYTLTLNFLQYYSVALFGGTPAESGYVIGAMRAVALVAGFLLGTLVDRWGPARSAPLGFLLVVAGTVGTFVSHSYIEMVAATLFFAVGAGWLNADLLPLALATASRELQGTAVGLFGSFEDVGLLIGPILIGNAYSLFGASSIFILVGGVGTAGVIVAVASAWATTNRFKIRTSY